MAGIAMGRLLGQAPGLLPYLLYCSTLYIHPFYWAAAQFALLLACSNLT